MDLSKVVPAILAYLQPATLLSVFGGLLWWVVKKAFTRAAEELKGVKDQLSAIEAITKVQAENHLHTIEAESLKQTSLLETMIKEQATTNGYLKAVVEIGKK
jgi:hypothetical protein